MSRAKKWKFVPGFAGALAIPVVYFVLVYFHVPVSHAQILAGAAGGVAAAVWSWWIAQPSDIVNVPEDLSFMERTKRALILALQCFLVETATGAIVLQIALVALSAADAVPADGAFVRSQVNRNVAIPVGMVLLYMLGFRASRTLPVRRPLRWLACVVLTWFTIRFSLFSLVVSVGQRESVSFPPLGIAIIRTIPTALLSYAVLAIGYLVGRERYRQP